MSSVFGSTEARHAGTAPKYISAAMQPTLYASKESSSSHDGDDERAGKKRRLTVEQARLLEMSFEREKKLQQHRKFQLAVELGLKPRQVAVWYQNRRARWKAKQLEQEYDILKQRYEQVLLEKQKLEAEVIRLAVELQMDERQMKEENITSGRTYGTEEDETWNKTSSICSDGPAKPYKELAGQRSDNEQAVPQPKQGTHRLQRHLLQNQVSPGGAEHSKRNDYRLIAAKSGDNNENMVSQQLYNSDLMAVAGQQVITAGCLDWFNF